MALKQVIAPRSNIALVAGERGSSDLVNGTKTWAVALTARATVDITTAGTGILNRGSVWSLFDEVGIEENGRDRHIYDGRMLRFISEMFAPSALTATRLASAAIATTVLEETAIVWMAHPLSASPVETVFRELDAREKLQVFAKQAATASLLGRVATGGALVGTVTGLSITAQQVHDPRTSQPPVFIPTFRQLTADVSGANADFEIFLKTSRFIRGLILQQFDDDGERADIVNSVSLRGDFRDLIGPQKFPWDEFTQYQEYEFGGNVVSNQAYLGLNFQRHGRLSNVVNPSDDVNLRLVLDVTASGTNPRIRVGLMELERVQGLVTPTIPFPI